MSIIIDIKSGVFAYNIAKKNPVLPKLYPKFYCNPDLLIVN